MPESFIAYTPGAGGKAHSFQRTIGANVVEDEVVVLGENYLGSSVIAPGGDISIATAASHVLQIMAGSTNKLRIRRIDIFQSVLATVAAIMPWQIMRLTTAGTGGSAQTPQVLDPADGTGYSAMALPTAKGTEGAVIWSGASYLMQTAGASSMMSEPMVSIDFDRLRTKPLIIAAGIANGICIKNINAAAGASVRVTVWVDESNF